VTDPNHAITALAALLSTLTMALLGLDHISVVWGFVGALFALYQSERMGRWRAICFVVLSTLGGAALGNGLLAAAGVQQPAGRLLLYMFCLVCGFGAQVIVARLLRRGLRAVDEGKSPAAAAGHDGGNRP
jgi:uncharacterized membrane protein